MGCRGCFPVMTASLLLFLATGTLTSVAAQDTGLSRAPYARLFLNEAPAASLAQGVAAQKPPEREHTGLSALIHATGSDFVAFPKRKSTWVILGIGGAAALLVHPWDTEINDELQEANTLKTVLKPGKYLGYGWVQGGAAVGMYLIGRYAMEPDPGTHTNRWSHLGFDLLRAQLMTQAFTYGIKYAVQRDRPTASAAHFRRATRRSRLRPRRSSSAISGIAPAGRCSSSPAMSRRAGSRTTATISATCCSDRRSASRPDGPSSAVTDATRSRCIRSRFGAASRWPVNGPRRPG